LQVKREHDEAIEPFDQAEYQRLETRYFKPVVEYNVELPGGTRLRRQTKPARIDGKSRGYKELRKHIAGLKKRNDHWGIFRKLRDLEQ
jgi:hypothetical protein